MTDDHHLPPKAKRRSWRKEYHYQVGYWAGNILLSVIGVVLASALTFLTFGVLSALLYIAVGVSWVVAAKTAGITSIVIGATLFAYWRLTLGGDDK